jgi:hypothetical protein
MAQIGAKIKLFRKFSGLRWLTALTPRNDIKSFSGAVANLL